MLRSIGSPTELLEVLEAGSDFGWFPQKLFVCCIVEGRRGLAVSVHGSSGDETLCFTKLGALPCTCDVIWSAGKSKQQRCTRASQCVYFAVMHKAFVGKSDRI